MFNKFDISGFSKSSNVAKNTDGWDTYRSTDITIMDSVINNGDGKQDLHPPLHLLLLNPPLLHLPPPSFFQPEYSPRLTHPATPHTAPT